MQFHEYTTRSDISSLRGGKRDWLAHLQKLPAAETDIAVAEGIWCARKRPFYNVYPAVVECLRNTSMRIKLSQLEPFSVTAICFAQGHEPTIDGWRATALLAFISKACQDMKTDEIYEDTALRIIGLGENRKQKYVSLLSMYASDFDGFLDSSSVLDGEQKWLVPIVVGVSLLARDERFAKPILLQRDADKQFRTSEELQVAIERAKRRGRNGMAIGKDLELSPHMRRPHFAIRWTGKGAAVPRLVPVKGAVVSRSKLYPIPTGYMDAVADPEPGRGRANTRPQLSPATTAGPQS